MAETVQTVKDSVQSSVESVRNTVQSSVETVRETFDVTRQVQRHPWAMFGGSIAVGFAAGWLLNRSTRTCSSSAPSWGYAPAAYTGATSRFAEEPPPASPARAEPSAAPSPDRSWLDELAQTFAPEIQKVKGLAIGAGMSLVRDLVSQSLPDHLRPQVAQMLDGITTKLGGEPVEGQLLEELLPRRQDDHHNGHHNAPRQEMPS